MKFGGMTYGDPFCVIRAKERLNDDASDSLKGINFNAAGGNNWCDKCQAKPKFDRTGPVNNWRVRCKCLQGAQS